MRLAKLLLASSLVASCAFADANGAFLGIQGGYNFKTDISVEDDTFDADQGFIGVKGGYDFGSYRAYGQYNYNTEYSESVSMDDGTGTTLLAEASFKGHELLFGVDFTPSLSDNFRLAVGPYLGLSLLKVDLSAGGESESKTEKGFILGGKVGGIFNFGRSEIELGLKADKSWHQGDEMWPDIDKTTFGGYVGYNYKF